jgi:hypothetical protein
MRAEFVIVAPANKVVDDGDIVSAARQLATNNDSRIDVAAHSVTCQHNFHSWT